MHTVSQTVMSSYPEHDPHWEKVVIYLKMNEYRKDGAATFQDLTKKRTWTNAGSVVLDTTTYKYNNGSAQFPGGTDNLGSCLATADSADLNFAANDFTMEAWIYPLFWPGGTFYPTIMSQRTTSTSNNAFTWYFASTGTWLQFSISTTGGAATHNPQQTFTYNLNTWYHVAVSRVGTNLYQFTNGQLLHTYNIGTNAIFNSSQVYKVGAFDSTTFDSYLYSYFCGNMSDIRVTNGVGRYREDFTPPLRSFPDK